MKDDIPPFPDYPELPPDEQAKLERLRMLYDRYVSCYTYPIMVPRQAMLPYIKGFAQQAQRLINSYLEHDERTRGQDASSRDD
jgi:hypothetical protein